MPTADTELDRALKELANAVDAHITEGVGMLQEDIACVLESEHGKAS